MMDEITNAITNNIGILALLAVTYGEAFGGKQSEITNAVIKAFGVKSRYKPAVNMLASIAVAALIGAVLAIYSTWSVVPLMAIAGLLAGTKAAQVHDTKNVPPAEPMSVASKYTGRTP